jgi:hypothetical protein
VIERRGLGEDRGRDLEWHHPEPGGRHLRKGPGKRATPWRRDLK